MSRPGPANPMTASSRFPPAGFTSLIHGYVGRVGRIGWRPAARWGAPAPAGAGKTIDPRPEPSYSRRTPPRPHHRPTGAPRLRSRSPSDPVQPEPHDDFRRPRIPQPFHRPGRLRSLRNPDRRILHACRAARPAEQRCPGRPEGSSEIAILGRDASAQCRPHQSPSSESIPGSKGSYGVVRSICLNFGRSHPSREPNLGE